MPVVTCCEKSFAPSDYFPVAFGVTLLSLFPGFPAGFVETFLPCGWLPFVMFKLLAGKEPLRNSPFWTIPKRTLASAETFSNGCLWKSQSLRPSTNSSGRCFGMCA